MQINSFSPVLLLFYFLLFVFIVPEGSHAELNSYVRKYDNIVIPENELRKLADFNHYINYYSSFSFFEPRHKVSPHFIKALILAESGCNPYAISDKEALGLGQILYSTGKQAAKEIYNSGRNFRYLDMRKLKDLQKEDLFDPAINILLTCYLIAKYNFRFDGKLDLVVSAWNAGENVDSLKIGLPAPYTETYNLIGKVNGFYIYLLSQKNKS